MRRVYVETSVWGMVPPAQNPTLREPTLEFLRQCERRLFEPCISEVVVDEISRAREEDQKVILKRMSEVNPILLPFPAEAERLAQRFIDQGVVPRLRLEDAKHVACAMVHELEVLVSWNYRHLANVRKAEGFNAVAVLSGMKAGLQIHTPMEVLE